MPGAVLEEPFARDLIAETEELLRRWRTPEQGDPAWERRRLMLRMQGVPAALLTWTSCFPM